MELCLSVGQRSSWHLDYSRSPPARWRAPALDRYRFHHHRRNPQIAGRLIGCRGEGRMRGEGCTRGRRGIRGGAPPGQTENSHRGVVGPRLEHDRVGILSEDDGPGPGNPVVVSHEDLECPPGGVQYRHSEGASPLSLPSRPRGPQPVSPCQGVLTVSWLVR
jgi:hypothetical protein